MERETWRVRDGDRDMESETWREKHGERNMEMGTWGNRIINKYIRKQM